MSDRLIKQHIRDICAGGLRLVTGKVLAVNDDMCQVELPGGLQLDEVRLRAVTGADDRLLSIPAVGSEVVCLVNEDESDALIISVERVENWAYKYDDFEVKINGTDKKVRIAKSGVDLKSILNDLITAIKQLKVYTPVGPSGTPLPDSIATLDQINTKINQILE